MVWYTDTIMELIALPLTAGAFAPYGSRIVLKFFTKNLTKGQDFYLFYTVTFVRDR